MTARSLLTAVAAVAIIAAGCGKEEPPSTSSATAGPAAPREAMDERLLRLPEYYGLHAAGAADVTPLKDDIDARPACDGRVEFILFEKAVRQGGGEWKVGGARWNENWEKIDLIDCRTKPVKDQPEMIRVIPVRALEPGVYAVAGKGPWGVRQGMFEVGIEPIVTNLRDQARNAAREKRWRDAIRHASLALAVRRKDAEMLTLSRQARDADRFENAMATAKNAASRETALDAALEALQIRPADKDALELRNQALDALRADSLYYGDHYGLVRRLNGHSETVTALAFSPDGRRLASGAKDRRVMIWDTKAWTSTSETRKNIVRALAWSSDSKLLASAGEDGTVSVNAASVQAHQGAAWTVAFCPGRAVLASGGEDKIARIRDAGTLQEIKSLPHPGPVYAVAFAPDGKTLATACEDRVVRFWDTASWKESRTLPANPRAVWRIAFHPDGKRLVAGNAAGLIQIWDLTTWKQTASIPGEGAGVLGITFRADGRSFAACYQGAAYADDIRLIDVEMGRILGTVQKTSFSCAAIAFSPDGKILAFDGMGAAVIDLWGVRISK